MKALNFIDLIFQTFVLGVVVLLCTAIMFSGNFDAIAMVALYGALFLGPWQLVSSLITCLSKGLYLKWRLIHLISSIVYLTVVWLLAAFFGNTDFNKVVTLIGGLVGSLIPAALALFYYFITVKSFQLARTQAYLNGARS